MSRMMGVNIWVAMTMMRMARPAREPQPRQREARRDGRHRVEQHGAAGDDEAIEEVARERHVLPDVQEVARLPVRPGSRWAGTSSISDAVLSAVESITTNGNMSSARIAASIPSWMPRRRTRRTARGRCSPVGAHRICGRAVWLASPLGHRSTFRHVSRVWTSANTSSTPNMITDTAAAPPMSYSLKPSLYR